jgi:large subunit ribosomal protein L21
MKFAIFESGGKQYRASEGQTVEVDRMPLENGDLVELEKVLLIAEDDNVTVGTPTVEGTKIKATVLEEIKGQKVIVFKYKPGVRYRRKQGHRQKYTRLQIDEIVTG